VLLGAAEVAGNDGDWRRALDWFNEALAIYRAGGHTRGEAACQFGLGRLIGTIPGRREASAMPELLAHNGDARHSCSILPGGVEWHAPSWLA
jgi:hypothetical protein